MRHHRDLIDELGELHSRMDRLMDGVFGPTVAMVRHEATTWRPAVDVVETQGAFIITVEVPGVAQDSIEVSLEDRILSIRGVRRREPLPDDASCRIMEIHYGAFERILRLPEPVAPEDVRAELRDGFLTVTLKRSASRAGLRVAVQ